MCVVDVGKRDLSCACLTDMSRELSWRRSLWWDGPMAEVDGEGSGGNLEEVALLYFLLLELAVGDYQIEV